ncbi:MAG: hypothetical protein Q8S19_07880, partial [Bacillota bacterium]|nr:hypothetical protein [Bacillota bacterium]
NTLDVDDALSQLGKYTDHRLHLDPYRNLELKTGGSAGTTIAQGSFVMDTPLATYYVKYWDMGNGIIQYDYRGEAKPKAVKSLAIAAVVIGGAIIIGTGQYQFAPLLWQTLELAR